MPDDSFEVISPLIARAESLTLPGVTVVTRSVAALGATNAGVPRNQITGPLCPMDEVSDQVLFEDATNPAVKYYLPRYRLTSENQQYQAVMERNGQSWSFTLRLEKYPPPEIAPAARAATELPHTPAVSLVYRLAAAVSPESMSFQEVTGEGASQRVVLRISSVAERDRLYQALTDPTYNPTLIVRRTATFAAPVSEVGAGQDGSAPPSPEARTIQQVATLRAHDLMRRVQALQTLLREIMQGRIAQSGPFNRLNDLNNGLVDLWGTLAGYGLGDDPYHDNIQVSSSGFIAGKDTPDFDMPGPYTAMGLPRLYERFLRQTGVSAAAAQGKQAQLNQLLAPYANAAVFPFREFNDRAYSAYRKGAEIGSPQYNADLSALDLGLASMEAALGQIPQFFALTSPVIPPEQAAAEMETLREIASLRCRDLLRRAQNLHTLLRDILQGQIGPAQPLNRLNDLNNDLADLWLTIAGYGLGDDPYHDRIMLSSNGFSAGKPTPDFGISGPHTALGVPRLHQRFLQLSGVAGDLYQTLVNRVAVMLEPVANPTVYPHRDFYERAYGSYRLGNDIGSPQYYADLSALDRWLTRLETLLTQTPQFFMAPAQPSAEPLFRQGSHTLDQAAEPNPFVFLPHLHGYIFHDIIPGAGQPLSVLRRQVGEHVYYQDRTQPHVFYYLPDSFKIGRAPAPPHEPLMSVRIHAADGGPQNSQVTLEYIAVPVVDASRLAADTPTLRDLAWSLPSGMDAPILQMLLIEAGQARLHLALPGPDGATTLQARDGALISPTGRIADTLELPMLRFKQVYDALMGGSLTLFQGQLSISLDSQGDVATPPIPFLARMSELAGELFDYQVTTDPSTGGLRVTLRNAIESPLRIDWLTAIVSRGGASVAAQVGELTAGLTLTPGQEVTLTLTPDLPLPGSDPLRVAFDLSGVQVQPDSERLWAAILDPTSPAPPSQKVTVCTVAQIFDQSVENPIVAVVVDFEGGDTVRLDAAHLQVDADVPRALSSWVLNEEDSDPYRYRLSVIRADGTPAEDSDWRSDTRTILYVNVNL